MQQMRLVNLKAHCYSTFFF